MPQDDTGQLIYMKWISFLVATGLFIFVVVYGVINDKAVDKIVPFAWLVLCGSIWGGNFMKILANISNRLK